MPNPRSTAQIAGHPIHPMLIPFPIAFFVSTFVADLVYWQTSSAAWANATVWLLGAGLVMAALAAVAGLTDVMGDAQIRNLRDAWLHAGGNVVVVLIELYNWYSRYQHGGDAIIPTGLNSLADRSADPALHRLEGLGDGLQVSRGCLRHITPAFAFSSVF
jgi:uncharacterized membrane protein